MINIGIIRNLVLIDISIVGEADERAIIYNVFDMDSLDSFLMTESVDEDKSMKSTEFLETVSLVNGKNIVGELFEYLDYLPMQFSVATVEGLITKPDDLIVIANPSDIDEKKIDKCMDYLKTLKK